MPALGLPKTLESIIACLLSCHDITSWRVTGEDENPVVVLRFNSSQHQDGEKSTHNTGAWRRKAPSQVRRDFQRAQKRYTANVKPPTYSKIRDKVAVNSFKDDREREEKASDTTLNCVSDSPSGLFLPTPEMTRATDSRSTRTHSFSVTPSPTTSPRYAREQRNNCDVPVTPPAACLNVNAFNWNDAARIVTDETTQDTCLTKSKTTHSDIEQEDDEEEEEELHAESTNMDIVHHESDDSDGASGEINSDTSMPIGLHDNRCPPVQEATTQELLLAFAAKIDNFSREMATERRKREDADAKYRYDNDTRSGIGTRSRTRRNRDLDQ